jgi:transposase
MPKVYSLDLRERVAGFVDSGRSRHAAAAHFKVSVSFVVNLMKAYRMTGRLTPKPGGGRRHAKLDLHRAFLLARVAEKDDITMPELAAELMAATGTRADPASISRWLIRNGYRFKKKRCWPANKIGPTSGKHARSGRPRGNQECGLNRTGWSFWMRPGPPRR